MASAVSWHRALAGSMGRGHEARFVEGFQALLADP